MTSNHTPKNTTRIKFYNVQPISQGHGRKIISDDNIAEIINTIDIPAEELPLRKALDKMCSIHPELDHKINFEDKSFSP